MGGGDYSATRVALSTDGYGVRYAEMRAWLLACVADRSCACGGNPPHPEARRGRGGSRVVEVPAVPGPVLDIEVWVEGNKAEAYTRELHHRATRRSAGTLDDKDVVNVFVTRYEKDDGVLRETVKLARRLAAERRLPGRRDEDRGRARADDQRPRRSVGDVAREEARGQGRRARPRRACRTSMVASYARALSVGAAGRRARGPAARRVPRTRPSRPEDKRLRSERRRSRTSTSTTRRRRSCRPATKKK